MTLKRRGSDRAYVLGGHVLSSRFRYSRGDVRLVGGLFFLVVSTSVCPFCAFDNQTIVVSQALSHHSISTGET